jgi:exopolyphosphatase/guanosine-5'-triphosphate,3'-diphosphate pyrophosphatase
VAEAPDGKRRTHGGASTLREPGALSAIDCGTNSTRLLVVDAEGRTLERRMRITRLGQGVDSTGRLAPEATLRTIATLEEYADLMDAHAVRRARLVATSAVRDATNAEDFLLAAARVTGLEPEVLEGGEEGRLSFLGATASLPPARITLGAPLEGGAAGGGHEELVVDIGGGSTELVAGVPGYAGASRGSPDGRASACSGQPSVVSLDIGCVRLTERFFQHDPPLPGELAQAAAYVDGEIAKARETLGQPSIPGRIIGLAGTVSTLACLVEGLDHYDRSRIHHALLRQEDVRGWLVTLSGESSARRLAHPGMVPGREDVIVGGLVVLERVMEAFEADTCLVSEDDILDGLVASLR